MEWNLNIVISCRLSRKWFSIVLILFAISLQINTAKENSTNSKDEKKLCVSEACNISADFISKSIDTSVDPCEDFYSFACNGWVKTNNLPMDVLQITVLNIFMEIIQIFKEVDVNTLPTAARKTIKAYKVCEDYDNFGEESLKWLQQFFKSIGGYPLLDSEWKEDEYDWLNSIAEIVKKLYIFPLLELDTQIDDKNSSNNRFLIGQPNRGQRKRVEEYALFPVIFGLAAGIEIKSYILLQNDLINLNEMQTKLDQITKYEDDFEPFEALDTIMKIEDLQKLIPNVDLLSLIRSVQSNDDNSVMGNSIPISSHITSDQKIIVRNKNYVLNLMNMIHNGTISKRTIANFLCFNAMLSIMDNFVKIFAQLINNYQKNSKFIRGINDRFKQENFFQILCFNSIVKPLGFAIDHIFLTNKRHSKSKLGTIANHLKKTFKQIMKREKWLDEDVKRKLVKKIKSMAVITDYPPWVIDPTKIEAFYEKLPEMTSNPLENLVRTRKFAQQISVQFIYNQNDRHKWPPVTGLPSSSLNAFYVKPFNSIVLPFVLQRLPIYDAERPEYLNYGALGMIIGHEMGHGFDKNNIIRNDLGNLINWKNDDFKNKFKARIQCIINHYTNYTYNEIGDHLDGKKTLSQNIADITGLRVALKAYKRLQNSKILEPHLIGLEKYTPEQMFFISFATTWCQSESSLVRQLKSEEGDHSPSKFRVLGSLSSLKEFSKVFKCKRGTPMHPNKQCCLW